MKLIDADVLYKVIKKDRDRLNIDDNIGYWLNYNIDYSHFLRRIAEQPEIIICKGRGKKNVNRIYLLYRK